MPADRVADGMKLATDGRLFVAGVTSGGIDVVAPDGELLDFIATHGAPQNCVFDGSDLYAPITDGRARSAARRSGSG